MTTARKILTFLFLSFLPLAVHASGGEVDHGEPSEEIVEKHHGGPTGARA